MKSNNTRYEYQIVFLLLCRRQWRCLLMFVMPHCRRIIFISPFSCVTMMKKRMFVSVISSKFHNKCLEIAFQIELNKSVVILNSKILSFFLSSFYTQSPAQSPYVAATMCCE
jgi:hypothetical protein